MNDDVSANLRIILIEVVSTFVILASYLFLSRWPITWFSAWTDWVAIGISTAVGVIVLNRLSFGPAMQLCVQIAYAVISVLAQIYFALVFVCTAFGDCL